METQKMNIQTTDTELTYTRVFDAPRALVFEAFSNCEHLKHWWGPRTWPISYCKVDFRMGGVWHYCMSGPNEGDEAWGKAIYKKIEAPELLVYDDYFSDKEGNIDKALPSTVASYEFEEQDGKTVIKGKAIYQNPEDLQKVIDMGMIAGMTETLDRLDEHLLTLK